MRAGLSLAALKDQAAFACAAILTIIALGIADPVQAGRGISIDNNTFEIWSDANDAQVVPLPFPVNYGAGPQTDLTVQVPTDFTINNGGLTFAAVGMTFTNSPSDVLFATINGGSQSGPPQVPGLRLSNETEVSTPFFPVDEASIFDFGNVVDADMAPPPFGSCPTIGITMDCYGPMVDSAIFHFIDLSSSGNPGDFELILQCENLCGNIGFNLGGVNFSADDFNPNAPQPPQLVDFSLGDQTELFHPGTWDFIFRNAAVLPEPSTWASMLLGFGLLGSVLRRQRKLRLQAS